MTSSASLLHSTSSSKMRDNDIRRFRTIAALIVGPILLISLVIYLVPPPYSSSSSSRSAAFSVALSQHHRKIPSSTSSSYAVIFDAGSSGSRVHVYRFDRSSLALLPIADSLELFISIKPGLSSYASDPAAAARSVLGMLINATDAVPASLRPTTPVRIGATAGLRSLPGDASVRILSAVRALLKEQSSFKVDDNAVSVLDGTQEGSYQWITINYLLRKLGGKYSDTVGVVDLGGGSVQMAYAISKSAAAKAPKPAEGEDAYVTKMKLMGKTYYLYVHRSSSRN